MGRRMSYCRSAYMLTDPVVMISVQDLYYQHSPLMKQLPHNEEIYQPAMLIWDERLGKYVSSIVLQCNVVEYYFVRSEALPNIMVAYIDVLCSSVIWIIFRNCNGGGIVTQNRGTFRNIGS